MDGIDLLWIYAFLLFSLSLGLMHWRRAGESPVEYFLAGRRGSWWLLGTSMVATTFSTDTPNLVTDLVRTYGVSGNWLWWAFLLTGLTTTFLFADLWRRAGLITDLGFYELRYGGRLGRFLRGFRAIYLGFFFNIIILASVTLAAIKLGFVLLGLSPVESVFLAGVVTVVYSMLGGLAGVVWTDLLQFGMAMAGSFLAAVWAVEHPKVGGLQRLFSNPQVRERAAVLPDFSNVEVWIPLFLIPLAVQWWSVWYPGSEPGGGGYVVQRLLAARNERHALGAALFFNVAHYALRPWPWILVALASLVVFPDLASLAAAFPQLDPQLVRHDLAYPAMLLELPPGLRGFVLASLLAAYMSTVSTHLNWGASYLVEDFYRPFLRPQASEREAVWVGRWSTVVLMGASGFLALSLSHALATFELLLQIGAGTGAIFLLRWFWWRVSAWAEMAAMASSFLGAVVFQVLWPAMGWVRLPAWQELLLGVGFTTAVWLSVAWWGPTTPQEQLERFVKTVQVGGPGWRAVLRRAQERGVELPPAEARFQKGLFRVFGGMVGVYGVLFGLGAWLAGRPVTALAWLGAAVVGALAIGLSLARQGGEKHEARHPEADG
jgi:Na+/proline symporter